MPKIPKDLLDAKIRAYENTYGKFTVIDTIDIMRLKEPTGNTYANTYRLYRDATNSVKRSLYEISEIMSKLPESYLLEILGSRDFGDFHRDVLTIKRDRRHIENSSEFDVDWFGIYSQALFYGLEGLMRIMPEQFTNKLLREILPFINTVESAIAFARAINPKSEIPALNIPDAIRESQVARGIAFNW